MEILKQAIGELLALATFFAFPAIQYLLLKALGRRKGQPELWYLPDFGFRLVIRNVPYRRTLTDLRYRAFIRRVVATSAGSSVATLSDRSLVENEAMVLFPGTDQILLSFALTANRTDHSGETVEVLVTDKLGRTEHTTVVDASDRMICDYFATIQNFFNFNVRMGKRVEIRGQSLFRMLDIIRASDIERSFPLDRVRNIQ